MGICAVIITKNEQHQIRRCLDSLKGWVDQIVIVDDESSDATVAIARDEYGAQIIVRSLNNRFDLQRNVGIDSCRQEWVLQMDADEVIPLQTVEHIKQAVLKHEHDAFEIMRQDCVWDVPLKHVGGCYQLKLFRKGKGAYRGAIHESLSIDGTVGRISNPVLHYAIPSITAMIAKHNFYTDLECSKYFKGNEKVDMRSLKKQLIFKPIKIFFKHYIKHGGYKDGVPGLMWSALHTLHPMMFWMKVIEYEARISGGK